MQHLAAAVDERKPDCADGHGSECTERQQLAENDAPPDDLLVRGPEPEDSVLGHERPERRPRTDGRRGVARAAPTKSKTPAATPAARATVCGSRETGRGGDTASSSATASAVVTATRVQNPRAVTSGHRAEPRRRWPRRGRRHRRGRRGDGRRTRRAGAPRFAVRSQQAQCFGPHDPPRAARSGSPVRPYLNRERQNIAVITTSAAASVGERRIDEGSADFGPHRPARALEPVPKRVVVVRRRLEASTASATTYSSSG